MIFSCVQYLRRLYLRREVVHAFLNLMYLLPLEFLMVLQLVLKLRESLVDLLLL